MATATKRHDTRTLYYIKHRTCTYVQYFYTYCDVLVFIEYSYRILEDVFIETDGDGFH